MTSAKNWKAGMSSCCKNRLDRALFEDYKAAGFDCMEVSFGMKDAADSANWKQIKADADAAGVELWSLHLPFAPFHLINIASMDAALRKSSMEQLTDWVKKGGDIGIGVAVIHPSGEPNKDEERSEQIKYASECLAELAEVGSKAGMTIAVEDLPRTCLGNCSGDILTMLAADDRLRCCFDTNHLLIQKDADFVRAVGEKIITLHVSDYEFRNERHWLPGEGKIDWVELVTALEEVSYSGPWMYEVSLDTPASITRSRSLTFADFRANYEAMIDKRPPVVIGTPAEEVCFASAYIK